VVRLEGNKAAEGKQILKKSGLKLTAATSLDEAAKLIVAATKGTK
jgi:succinyl-CoA synthetase beta subunit